MKWFLAGLGIGTTIGVLYAPRSGAETRNNLSEAATRGADQLRERASQTFSDVTERATQVADQARERVGAVTDRATQLADSAREQVSGIADRVRGTSDLEPVIRHNGQTVNEEESGSGNGSSGLLEIINEWPQDRLIAIDGIGPVLAGKIITNRPYESPQQLVDSKVLPPSAIEALQKAS